MRDMSRVPISGGVRASTVGAEQPVVVGATADCRSRLVGRPAYASRLTPHPLPDPATVVPCRRSRRRVARVRAAVAGRLDVAIALGLLVVTSIDMATRTLQPGQHPADLWGYLLVAGMSLPFVLHRRAPLMTVTVVLGLLVVYALVPYSAYPGLIAFVLLFAVAAHSDRRRSVIALVATLGGADRGRCRAAGGNRRPIDLGVHRARHGGGVARGGQPAAAEGPHGRAARARRRPGAGARRPGPTGRRRGAAAHRPRAARRGRALA